MPETAPDATNGIPAQSIEPAQAEMNWDQLREQWETEKLTPSQVADSLKNSRKWESRAKENKKALDEAKPVLDQWKQLEEASKTETQRAQEEATRWQTEATTWRTRAVSSRAETLAAADFADPSDALTVIKPEDYLGAGGEIDDARLKADLAAALERKPHWRRTADQAAPRVPAPNPAQGSGVNGKPAANPAAEFGALVQGLLK